YNIERVKRPKRKKADGIAVRGAPRTGAAPGGGSELFVASAQRHGNEDPGVIALDEEGNRLPRLVDRALQLLDAFHGRVIDRDDPTARPNARALCRARHVLNNQPVVEVGAALLVGAEGTYRNTQFGFAERFLVTCIGDRLVLDRADRGGE